MNPFLCGTIAHNAWNSRTGESNCDNDNRKKEPRIKHKPIGVPRRFLKKMFELDKGVMPKGWKEEQLLNRYCV